MSQYSRTLQCTHHWPGAPLTRRRRVKLCKRKQFDSLLIHGFSMRQHRSRRRFIPTKWKLVEPASSHHKSNDGQMVDEATIFYGQLIMIFNSHWFLLAMNVRLQNHLATNKKKNVGCQSLHPFKNDKSFSLYLTDEYLHVKWLQQFVAPREVQRKRRGVFFRLHSGAWAVGTDQPAARKPIIHLHGPLFTN